MAGFKRVAVEKRTSRLRKVYKQEILLLMSMNKIGKLDFIEIMLTMVIMLLVIFFLWVTFVK